ncbi:MAG: hypothetical protein AAF998_17835 [Bacteroidota bacterium]
MLGFRFMIGMLMILAGGAAIGIGYQKYKFLLKMIFGKDRLKKQGKDTLSMYLYLIGGGFILLGLLIIF